MKKETFLTVFSDFHIEFSNLKDQEIFNQILDEIFEKTKHNVEQTTEKLTIWNESIAKVIAKKMGWKETTKSKLLTN